ncbi:MAG: nucleotide exchange factor GrpE [Spirochaetia bacterium]|jgi:molecular chaperone GrpE|nr:nucleotide exchange factor GrpE [Spirochaetia bacterium]
MTKDKKYHEDLSDGVSEEECKIEDENAAAPENPEAEPRDDEALEKLQAELAAAKDLLLRRQADFDNYKKRMAKLQDDNRKLALRDIAAGIVEINDDLLRAIDAAAVISDENGQKDVNDSFVQGVSMISKRIESLLEKYGVVEIDALNQEFDPNLHEAIEMGTGEVERDTVTFVHQKGYLMNDLLLRSAKVKVTKPERKDEKKPSEAEEALELQ